MNKVLREVIRGFSKVERHIFYLIGAIFCLQLIDGSFFILFNYYLRSLNYSDTIIAELVSYRFMAIMVVAFPLGLFIKGRYLKPFFVFAAIFTPLFSLGILYALELNNIALAKMFMVGFGLARICMGVTTLPFIILNAKKEYHSEALSMFFQTFSATAFVAGISFFLLHSWIPTFTEREALLMFSGIGFLSIFFVSRIKIEENKSEIIPLSTIFEAYDWGLIFKVSVPTFLVAFGAGFTIPFINLFFESVHGISSGSFSLYGAFSSVVVTIMMFFIPIIRRRFGYMSTISLFQSLAVLALIIMATTQWYANWEYAAGIAVIAFLARQPLMNIANPAISEFNLYYVGKRNQEMIGAINAAIWSGSWFFSAKLFGWLRYQEVSYVNIFLITAVFYAIAISWYMWLIHGYNKQQAKIKENAPTPDLEEEISNTI